MINKKIYISVISVIISISLFACNNTQQKPTYNYKILTALLSNKSGKVLNNNMVIWERDFSSNGEFYGEFDSVWIHDSNSIMILAYIHHAVVDTNIKFNGGVVIDDYSVPVNFSITVDNGYPEYGQIRSELTNLQKNKDAAYALAKDRAQKDFLQGAPYVEVNYNLYKITNNESAQIAGKYVRILANQYIESK